MADDKPGRGSDQFALRLPDGMRDQIKTLADANGRSMNAEIVARLEKSIVMEAAWLNALENIDDALARIEKLETQIYYLQQATGHRD